MYTYDQDDVPVDFHRIGAVAVAAVCAACGSGYVVSALRNTAAAQVTLNNGQQLVL